MCILWCIFGLCDWLKEATHTHTHKMRSRHNLLIDDKVWEWLEEEALRRKRSISRLVEHAIIKTYEDPLKTIEEEAVQLRKRLIELSSQKDDILQKRNIEKMVADPMN